MKHRILELSLRQLCDLNKKIAEFGSMRGPIDIKYPQYKYAWVHVDDYKEARKLGWEDV